MCSPVLTSRWCILHAIAKLNGASHCTAPNQGLLCRSRKKSEVLGWSQGLSRIPNNTGNRSENALSDSESPIESFFTSHS